MLSNGRNSSHDCDGGHTKKEATYVRVPPTRARLYRERRERSRFKVLSRAIQYEGPEVL